jgi:hypothetical protein
MSRTPPEYTRPNGASSDGEDWEAVLPVPETAVEPTFRHPRHGEPTTVWRYEALDGALLHYVCRFDTPSGAKVVLPHCFGLLDGDAGWHWRAPRAPRPLYRLLDLDAAPTLLPVLVVEGEKTCDAARRLVPECVAVTWSGGSKAVSKVDWSPLKGRRVIIWPDNDQPGRTAAEQIGDLLLEVADEVRIVNPPPDMPLGWDLADEVPHGVDIQQLLACAEIYVDRAERIVEDAQTDPGAPFEPKALDFLAALRTGDKAAYERTRARLKKAKVRVPVLDEEVLARAAERKQTQQPQPPDIDALAASAKAIIASTDVLEIFADSLSTVIAGETRNAKILYLVGTSRVFDRVMSAAIKGPSGAGKSEIRKRVLGYFPPEDVIAFTTLSEKALLYFEEDFPHKILSMGEAAGAEEQSLQDYLLRELISEGRLRYPVVQKIGGEMVTTTIEKNGPVAFLVTTTKHALDPEVETRMLSLEVDDSAAQTRLVLHKVAEVEGTSVASDETRDLDRWRDFQRWLAADPIRVVVPFADALAELMSDRAVRLRRDIGQLLRAIKAHALLHREHRARNFGRIVADIELDYAPVRELLGDVVAQTAGLAISATMQETVATVRELTSTATAPGVTALEVGKKLKLDKSAARRRLLSAASGGHLINLETRRGQPGKYTVSPTAIDAAELLPTAEELLETYSRGTPRKPVPPCHLIQKDTQDQEVGGGNAGGTGGKAHATRGTVANGAEDVPPAVLPVTPCATGENPDRWHGGKGNGELPAGICAREGCKAPVAERSRYCAAHERKVRRPATEQPVPPIEELP